MRQPRIREAKFLGRNRFKLTIASLDAEQPYAERNDGHPFRRRVASVRATTHRTIVDT
jgi:hypothetical protein